MRVFLARRQKVCGCVWGRRGRGGPRWGEHVSKCSFVCSLICVSVCLASLSGLEGDVFLKYHYFHSSTETQS